MPEKSLRLINYSRINLKIHSVVLNEPMSMWFSPANFSFQQDLPYVWLAWPLKMKSPLLGGAPLSLATRRSVEVERARVKADRGGHELVLEVKV